jgi:hypothetical protein
MTASPFRPGALALAAAALACATSPKPAPPTSPPAAAPVAPAPLPAPAPPGAAALLAGCAAAPEENLGWRYHCGSAVALLADHFDEPADKVMAAGLAALRAASPLEPAGQPLELLLDGEPRPAVRAVVSRPTHGGAPRFLSEGAMAVVDYGEGRARLLTCMARADAGGARRCDALLEALSARPWRGDPVVKPGRWPPSMAGREVLWPDGCEAFAEGPGGIVRCPDGTSFAWASAPKLVALEAAAKERLAWVRAWAGPAAEIEDQDCLVDGAEATCRCALARRSEGAVRMCLATAAVRGQAVLVACRAPGQAIPPACDAIDLEAP